MNPAEKIESGHFFRDFVAYWRGKPDFFLKLAVISGLLLHVSFYISLDTGFWDEWFNDSAPAFVTKEDGSLGEEEKRQATDFFAIYLASHELVNGRSIYPVEHLPEYQDAVDGMSEEWKKRLKIEENPQRDYSAVPYFDPFRYLPSASYAGTALLLFEPWTAYRVWVIIYEILFLVSIFWIGHRFGSMRSLHIAAAMYFFFTPWYPEIYMGQYSFLQSVLILGMLLTSGSGGLASGKWWVASVMWKLNTAICLPAFLCWKFWKPLIWLAAVFIVTCVPYFIIFPADGLKFAAINFRPLGVADPGNFGLQGLISKFFAAIGNGNDIPMRTTVQYLVIGILLLAGVHATLRAGREQFAECLAMWVVTYFLIYQDVWEHQYVMLLPVVVFLYLKKPSRALLIIWFLLACPTTYRFFHEELRLSIIAGEPLDRLNDTSFFNDWHYTLIKPLGLMGLYVYCQGLLKPR